MMYKEKGKIVACKTAENLYMKILDHESQLSILKNKAGDLNIEIKEDSIVFKTTFSFSEIKEIKRFLNQTFKDIDKLDVR